MAVSGEIQPSGGSGRAACFPDGVADDGGPRQPGARGAASAPELRARYLPPRRCLAFRRAAGVGACSPSPPQGPGLSSSPVRKELHNFMLRYFIIFDDMHRIRVSFFWELISNLLDIAGMGNGSRGRRWQAFRS